jgi:CheY-like chemotaxis protein
MSRVLLIDDDQAIRDTLRVILDGMGHQVVAVTNGLEVPADGQFDLMITDIFMPHMDGFETIQKMKQRHPALKIIAMSGGMPRSPTVDYLGMARLLGADKVLAKPFTLDQLAAAIRDILT